MTIRMAADTSVCWVTSFSSAISCSVRSTTVAMSLDPFSCWLLGPVQYQRLDHCNNMEEVSHHDLRHHSPGHVGQPEIAPGVAIRELLMIQAKQVQYGGMQVVHVDFVLNG